MHVKKNDIYKYIKKLIAAEKKNFAVKKLGYLYFYNEDYFC